MVGPMSARVPYTPSPVPSRLLIDAFLPILTLFRCQMSAYLRHQPCPSSLRALGVFQQGAVAVAELLACLCSRATFCLQAAMTSRDASANRPKTAPGAGE
jgi:hypothetical protein